MAQKRSDCSHLKDRISKLFCNSRSLSALDSNFVCAHVSKNLITSGLVHFVDLFEFICPYKYLSVGGSHFHCVRKDNRHEIHVDRWGGEVVTATPNILRKLSEILMIPSSCCLRQREREKCTLFYIRNSYTLK